MRLFQTMITVCTLTIGLSSMLTDSADAAGLADKQKTAALQPARKKTAVKRVAAPKTASQRQFAPGVTSTKPALPAARSTSKSTATKTGSKSSTSTNVQTRRAATAAKSKNAADAVAKKKKPKRGGKGSTPSNHPSLTDGTGNGTKNGKRSTGPAAGTQNPTSVRNRFQTLQQRWDLVQQDLGYPSDTHQEPHPNGRDTVYTSTHPNGTLRTAIRHDGNFDSLITSFQRPDRTIDIVREGQGGVVEWLQIHPDDSETYRNKDGIVHKTDSLGQTIFPAQPTPTPPANDGRRKVIDLNNPRQFTDWTPFPVAGGRTPPGAGNRPADPTIPGPCTDDVHRAYVGQRISRTN